MQRQHCLIYPIHHLVSLTQEKGLVEQIIYQVSFDICICTFEIIYVQGKKNRMDHFTLKQCFLPVIKMGVALGFSDYKTILVLDL